MGAGWPQVWVLEALGSGAAEYGAMAEEARRRAYEGVLDVARDHSDRLTFLGPGSGNPAARETHRPLSYVVTGKVIRFTETSCMC